MERFGKRRLEPGRWAAAQGWKCERPRLTRLAGSVAGEAPGCGAVFVSGLLASLSSLTASAACCDNSTRTHTRAHTPLFKAQRRSLALRGVSCGIVVRTKFDGERCCEACAQRAAAGDADGGTGG